MYLLSNPKSILFQLFPPSTDLYAPPFSDPLIIVHGFLSTLQEAAYIVLGSSGANSTSTTPIASEIYNIFSHVFPPSLVSYRPLSLLLLNGCPIAATSTWSGLSG